MAPNENVFEKNRAQFPAFNKTESTTEFPLVYLDNAATTQKPQQVIDRIKDYYTYEVAPVHRAVYPRAEQLTYSIEAARKTIAEFFGVQSTEIIFCSGATDAVNLVAQGWLAQHLNYGDEIVLSDAEHHSNFVAWQQIALHKGAVIKLLPVTKSGTIWAEKASELITNRTKFVAITHTSHVTGLPTDLLPILEAAHAVGAKLFLDCAQAVAHASLNFKDLGIDFAAFSGHKVFGPTGIGVLFVNNKLINELQPVRFGGGAVEHVTIHKTVLNTSIARFEPGSNHAAGILGLEAALLFLKQEVPFQAVAAFESELIQLAIYGLLKIPGIKFVVDVDLLVSQKLHLISFYHQTVHAHDLAAFLGSYNICVRAGYHCAYPLAEALDLPASVRLSVAFYNTHDEIKFFLLILQKAIEHFSQ